jgi:hypothetical protein
MLAYPFAARELEHATAFEAALRAEVHVLDTRGISESRELEEA